LFEKTGCFAPVKRLPEKIFSEVTYNHVDQDVSSYSTRLNSFCVCLVFWDQFIQQTLPRYIDPGNQTNTKWIESSWIGTNVLIDVIMGHFKEEKWTFQFMVSSPVLKPTL